MVTTGVIFISPRSLLCWAYCFLGEGDEDKAEMKSIVYSNTV